ncbi:hypothetical protein PV325_006730, partial [Microctonus aethiopoides]
SPLSSANAGTSNIKSAAAAERGYKWSKRRQSDIRRDGGFTLECFSSTELCNKPEGKNNVKRSEQVLQFDYNVQQMFVSDEEKRRITQFDRTVRYSTKEICERFSLTKMYSERKRMLVPMEVSV